VTDLQETSPLRRVVLAGLRRIETTLQPTAPPSSPGHADASESTSHADVSEAPAEKVEDSFCLAFPTPENAVNLFAGQWSSRLPAPYQALTGANAGLFEDERITFAESQFGFKGMRVIELGPLEGGHTYMLDRLGAEEVISIEANKDAFLRCLVAKELLGIPSARFLCGDFVAYLRDAAEKSLRWDLCLAVGVLYHQQDPVALLQLATQVSDRLFLWTHYYDADVVAGRPDLIRKFSASEEHVTGGFRHTLHRWEYLDALGWSGFCGGSSNWVSWLSRDDLFGALDHFGFRVTGTDFDEKDHQNGPAICIAAEKR
jgi:hypothetical protein